MVARVSRLCPLSTDSAGKLDVLGHDGHSLRVDRAKVSVLKESHKIRFRGFLECSNSRGLESQVGLEVLSNLTNQTLEGQLSDQELSALLVSSDLTKSHGTGPEPVGLLDSTRGRCALARCLGGKLLTRSFSSSRFLYINMSTLQT